MYTKQKTLHCVWQKQGKGKGKEMEEERGEERKEKRKKNPLSCFGLEDRNGGKHCLLVGS